MDFYKLSYLFMIDPLYPYMVIYAISMQNFLLFRVQKLLLSLVNRPFIYPGNHIFTLPYLVKIRLSLFYIGKLPLTSPYRLFSTIHVYVPLIYTYLIDIIYIHNIYIISLSNRNI